MAFSGDGRKLDGRNFRLPFHCLPLKRIWWRRWCGRRWCQPCRELSEHGDRWEPPARRRWRDERAEAASRPGWVTPRPERRSWTGNWTPELEEGELCSTSELFLLVVRMIDHNSSHDNWTGQRIISLNWSLNGGQSFTYSWLLCLLVGKWDHFWCELNWQSKQAGWAKKQSIYLDVCGRRQSECFHYFYLLDIGRICLITFWTASSD